MRLGRMVWKQEELSYRLLQCDCDSQVWRVMREKRSTKKVGEKVRSLAKVDVKVKTHTHEVPVSRFGGKGWKQRDGSGERVSGRSNSQVRANSVKGHDGIRRSETLNPWSSMECVHWKRGHCRDGIRCRHRDDGFPIANADGLVDKCFVCGKSGHHSSECTAPGGGKDPDHANTWSDYQKMKREKGYMSAKDKDVTKGKGKSKGNGEAKKGKRRRKGQVRQGQVKIHLLL